MRDRQEPRTQDQQPFARSSECNEPSSAGRLSRRGLLHVAAWLPMISIDMAKAFVRGREPVKTKAKDIEVVHTRVFAAGQNGGNPCPVIPRADELTELEMQRIARKFGLEAVFILPPMTKAGDIRLRYFVPDHEMGVSGHATIAAITVARLNSTTTSGRVRVETMTGIFGVEVTHDGNNLSVTLEQNKPVFGPAVAPDVVARALNIDPKRIALAEGPIQSVSVSRAKLLVPLEDSKALDNLAPDYPALWKACETLQVTGFYPFTRNTDKANVQAEARQFPLRAGFPEDAATGVAAAALGAYLANYDRKSKTGQYVFRIAQGYAMRAPSLIEAIIECAEGTVARTAIRGEAEIVGRERIEL